MNNYYSDSEMLDPTVPHNKPMTNSELIYALDKLLNDLEARNSQ